MKTLSQISIADFVDILCGDYSSLEMDKLSWDEQMEAVRGLINQYRAIADPTGTEALVQENVALVMAEGKVRLARLLRVLLDMDAADDVRELLREYGAADGGTDLRGAVDRLQRQSELDIKRIRAAEQEKPVEEPDYRSAYDSEFAFVMTHFHMTFDPRTLSAAVYANMLHRADMEIRAMARAASKN
ncbi:MAG: hypothetical protein Q4D30_01360 [Bacteroidales bacterium]|nr:hypothetical protein [Bacteroidales bacterium]